MKRLLLAVLVTGFCFSALAQFPFRTGSVQIDADLNSINTHAKLDLGAFKTELNTTFKVPIPKIDFMTSKLKMQPAECFFALEIGKQTKKPIDEVLKIYSANKSKGWGYIAKQAGIKPGSPQFHALKNSASGKAKKSKGKGNKVHPNKGNKSHKGNHPGKGKGKKK